MSFNFASWDEIAADATARRLDEHIRRLVEVEQRMEEDSLRDEVIRVLRAQGYTVIPPGGVAP